jgi:2-hydroxyglutaryl-CoA dehydratase, D-component
VNQQITDYRPMWETLGLDLDGYDALLSAIPVLYQEAYLSQTDRPEGMAYFDFVMSEIHGLRIKELVDHKAAGSPALRIDTDYSMGDVGKLSTRVEAFLEMIE